MALNSHHWSVDETICSLASRAPKGAGSIPIALSGANTFVFCEVCAVNQAVSSFSFLSCLHHFCKGCWELHFECQILQGISTSKKFGPFLEHFRSPVILTFLNFPGLLRVFGFSDYFGLRNCVRPRALGILRREIQKNQKTRQPDLFLK